jgi:hypothetical protein
MDKVELTQPGLAIIIGCWQQHLTELHQEVYQQIINFVCDSPAIQTVVISDKHTAITQDPWHKNTREIFFDSQGVDWIRRYYVELASRNAGSAFGVTVAETLLNCNWNNKTCIAISEQWQLEYLLRNDFSHIKNVWYFGVGWNVGVQRDYIGWGQLCDSVKFNHVPNTFNILTKKACCLVNVTTDPNVHYTKCVFEYPSFDHSDWDVVTDDIHVKTTRDWNYRRENFIPELTKG